MIVRVHFGKEGALRFIGHLDVLRTFQKIFRRAGIPMQYSQGYSPHPIMSFALPLGLGLTSEGEYLDAGVEDSFPPEELLPRLRAAVTEELPVYGACILPEDAENAMSTVGSAAYRILPPAGVEAGQLAAAAAHFLTQESFIIAKKTKTTVADTDIRPMVSVLEAQGGGLLAVLAAGSKANLKPELLLESMAPGYYEYCEQGWRIRRLDLMDHEGRPLGSIGRAL